MRFDVGEWVEFAARFLLGSLTSDLHAVWSDLAALALFIAALIMERSALDMAAMLERCGKSDLGEVPKDHTCEDQLLVAL